MVIKTKGTIGKRFLTGLLFLVVLLCRYPVEGKAAQVPTEQQVYEKIIALMESYPEGMTWTNANYYGWKGGIYSGGYGCAGFAFLCSDKAFGDLPARMIEDFSMKDIHVGDILRTDYNTHSVIVLEVKADSVIVAEGNFNSAIHWGREITTDELKSAAYLMTRYPKESSSKAKKQKITVEAPFNKTLYVNASALQKKGKNYQLTAKAKGKITYAVKQGSSKYIKVSSDGKVTLKKNCRKGTYKISITAAATKNGKYKKTTKIVIIVVQ